MSELVIEFLARNWFFLIIIAVLIYALWLFRRKATHFNSATEFEKLINDGYPIGYNIGFDDDGDGMIDETIPIDYLYYPNEVVFFMLDDATYYGRVHLMQDLGMRLGDLIIDVVGVPKHFLDDPTLPKTISAQTTIEITDFNYS